MLVKRGRVCCRFFGSGWDWKRPPGHAGCLLCRRRQGSWEQGWPWSGASCGRQRQRQVGRRFQARTFSGRQLPPASLEGGSSGDGTTGGREMEGSGCPFWADSGHPSALTRTALQFSQQAASPSCQVHGQRLDLVTSPTHTSRGKLKDWTDGEPPLLLRTSPTSIEACDIDQFVA